MEFYQRSGRIKKKDEGDNKHIDRLKVRSCAVKEVKRTGDKVTNNKSGAKRSKLVPGRKARNRSGN